MKNKNITQISNKLNNQIKTGNWTAFANELNRICGVIVLNDFVFDEPFINKIKQNKLTSYGDGMEIRSLGKAYMVDWQPLETKEKEVSNCLGRKVKVKYVVCPRQNDAQVPTVYKDFLLNTDDKQLTIFIDYDEARKSACGVDTFNEIVKLVEGKLNEAVIDYLYDIVICDLNNPENFKQIKEVQYCSCNGCDGLTLLGAINKFALQLQKNTSDYNIAERDYNLPIQNQWLLTSYDLDSRISDILSSKYNKDIGNPITKFGYYHYLNINIADFIIVDEHWYQLHEVYRDTGSENKIAMRGTCTTINYIARRKAINHRVAVPVKLVKVSCADLQEVDKQITEIASIKVSDRTVEVADNVQSTAETSVTAQIEKLVPKKDTTYKYTYSNFTVPTTEKNGSIDVEVEVSKNNVKESTTLTFNLKLTT